METNIINENQEFKKLEEDWDLALSNSNINNIFLTFDWVYAWWQYLKENNQLFIITVFEGRDMVGIAPLMLSKKSGFRQLCFIGGQLSDYEDIITIGSPEKREQIIRSIIAKIQEVKGWDVFRLKGIRHNSLNFVPFSNVRSGIDKSVAYLNLHKDGAPYLSISEDWDKYCSQLRRGFLADTKRQLLRLKKENNIFISEADNADEVTALVNKLMDFHIARYRTKKTKSIFEDQSMADFFKAISLNFFKKGWLSLNYLKINEEIASVHLGFRNNDKLYYYMPVFNEKFQQYSIGRLLLFDLIRKSFGEKILEFDFMLGEEDYKRDWNPNIETVYYFNMFPKTIPGYIAYIRFIKLSIGIKKLFGGKW